MKTPIDNYISENCGFVFSDDDVPTPREIEDYFTPDNFRAMFGPDWNAEQGEDDCEAGLQYPFETMIARVKEILSR